MKPNTKYVSRFIVVFSLLASVWGCASMGSAKPNIPYRGTYPESFEQIQQANPLLATELLKLPEIQDGISDEEAIALGKIVEIYNNSPADFDKTFDQMYKVGLPDVRRYCSPLQALFWLAKDGKHDELTSSLRNYSLLSLLDNSWFSNYRAYKGKVLDITKKQANKIISSLDKDEQRIYDGITEMPILNYVILSRYIENPRKFPQKTRKFIKDALKASKHSKFMLKWGRFNTVVERLNAPELIDYYERRQIGYSRGHSYDMSPREVFTMKTGHCISVTALTVYCLRKAGYKAWDHRVASPTGHPAGHHVAAFDSNGEKYVMDNGRPNPRGIIPFESYSP